MLLITRMITERIELHSVQLSLLIGGAIKNEVRVREVHLKLIFYRPLMDIDKIGIKCFIYNAFAAIVRG